MHLEHFYLAVAGNIQGNKERERGHLRNESCGLCCPRATPDPFFHYFPKERLFSAARFGYYTDIMAGTQHCLATAVDSFSPRRSSLGEIPCPRFVGVTWIQDVRVQHMFLFWCGLSLWVRRARGDVLSSSLSLFTKASGIFLQVSYPTVLLILSCPFNCRRHTSSFKKNHKLLKRIMGPSNHTAGPLETSSAFAHTRVRTHSRTHLVSVSNAFPYIFSPVHPHTHNSLFYPV